MKDFSRFSFVKSSTPTTEVQEFIYTTMQKICDIQEELGNAILDYMGEDEPDGVKFGLQVAEARGGLKWLADMLETIHNNSVRFCPKQQQEGGAK